MKWIGQHIVSLIARFRSDVYLENISTGTIASGAHLGLDSKNKIVKAVDGGGDLTSIVAGTGLSGTDLTGPIPTLNVDASIPEITTLAGLTSIGTDGDTLNILGDTVTIVNTTSSKPAMNFTNQADDASGPIITLKNQRVDSSTQAGEANDFLGKIFFTGFDDQGSPATQNYASVTSQIHDATSGQESGILNLQVANHDGGLETGLKLTGGSVNSEIDVAVGLGAASVTTVAGTLTVGSTAALDNSGVVKVAAQPDITTLAGVTALGTAGNDLTVTSDKVVFASAAASDPLVNIQNTANDASAPRLRFTKNRGGDAVDADNVGEISFHSYDDGTPSTQEYARIKAQVHDATSDEESGSLQFFVANHDGGVQAGLSIVGGDEDGEINVNLGLGANSAVIIPGNVDLAGDIDVDGTLETDALTIGGATIAAIGTTAITTLGTIGTGVWEGTAIASDQQKHLMHYDFKGYAVGDGTNYEIPVHAQDNNAPFEHNTNTGSAGTNALSVQNQIRTVGSVMPRGVTLKKWTGWATGEGAGGSSGTITISLFKLTPANDSNSTVAPVLLDTATFESAGNATSFAIAETSFTVATVAAGDIVFTGVKTENSGQDVYFTSTLEVEF